MGETGNIFKGFLLIAIGIIVIYESYIYNLLDIILLAGIILLFVGLALLFIVLTGRDIQNQDTLYNQTVNTFNRQRNNIGQETRKIVSMDSKNPINNNESIFTNINRQFARKYNPDVSDEIYITPEHDNNPETPNYDFQYPENTVITPKTDNNQNSHNPEPTMETVENKDVLNVNEEWSKNEELTPIQTEHVQDLPDDIYEDSEDYAFTSNYERPVMVTRKPRKKTEHRNDEYEAIVPQDRRRTASIITEEDIKEDDFNEEEVIVPQHDVNPQDVIEPEPQILEEEEEPIEPEPVAEPVEEEPEIFEREIEDGSYVICEQGILTSKEAFELIVKNAKSEVLLEVPNLKDLSIKFLTVITKLNTRLIIQKFSIEETSYMLLLTALIERGIDVKVLNVVNTSNLITDDSHALIISKNPEDEMNYGAVYTDAESVKMIKEDFNKSWEIAHDMQTELENMRKMK